MKIRRGEELTYCTNIHSGESWDDVLSNLSQYVLSVKATVARDKKFGIGLRLSAQAAQELAAPKRLREFKSWLIQNNCYVFTLNGFPYGNFHDQRVKENVYLPDWTDKSRVDYTILLSELLAELLPDDVAYGSISTVPVGFREQIVSEKTVSTAVDNLMYVVRYLIELEYQSGKRIVLALEPEPCCFLETIAETVSFFNQKVFAEVEIEKLSKQLNISAAEANSKIRQHIGICLDLCHAAVEFERPEHVISQIRSANIQIPKMQISSGLRISPVDDARVQQLLAFNDEVYLHQVVEKVGPHLNRFVDIDAAVAQYYANSDAQSIQDREWRVHFHVPVFLDQLTVFHTSQSFLKTILAEHVRHSLTQHLEVETYTWNVLPEQYRQNSTVELLTRELDWVVTQLQS